MYLISFIVAFLCLVELNAFQPLASRVSVSGIQMISEGRRPMMGGNWKLNPTTISAATSLVTDLSKLIADINSVDTVIFPPFPLLPIIQPKLKGTNIKLGAQDMFFESAGAFTGAVSTELLKEVGVTHVLIGHSERRTIFKETDDIINKKVKKALKDGLKPVLCIGETKAEYEAGLNQKVCATQLMEDLKDISAEEFLNIVIAYEPVWAIGTGLVCPKEVAQSVHQYIRSVIASKYGSEVAKKTVIQYGGSVNEKNVKDLMAMPDIDGCLVGGASLNAINFSKIVGFELL